MSTSTNGFRFEIAPKLVLRSMVAAVVAYPPKLRRLILVLCAIMGVSLFADLIALPAGWEVMGTTPTVEWGLLIAGYVFLAITTSGLCLTSSLGSVLGIEAFKPIERRAVLLAFFALVGAFGIILLDLQYPIALVFGAILSPSVASPMWWMGVAYGAYLMILIVEIITIFANLHTLHRWVARAAMLMAIIAPSTLGTVFGVIAAKPMWHGIWTPILMFASAILAGASMISLVMGLMVRYQRPNWEALRDRTLPALRIMMVIMLLVVSGLIARQIIDGMTSGVRGYESAMHTLIAGSLAPGFWGLRVALGLIIPLGLLLMSSGRTATRLAIAGGLSLMGILVDRYLFVVAAEVTPVSITGGVVQLPVAPYTPSIVELLIMAGAVASVAFFFVMAERHLDLAGVDSHHKTDE